MFRVSGMHLESWWFAWLGMTLFSITVTECFTIGNFINIFTRNTMNGKLQLQQQPFMPIL